MKYDKSYLRKKYLIQRKKGDHSEKRLRIMESTIDGFKISDEDLRLRGPGDFFGTQQHGYIKSEIITPKEFIGSVMNLCNSHRGHYISTNYLSTDKVQMVFEIPLAEIIYDFFEKLKSISKGYASLDYELIESQKTKLTNIITYHNLHKILETLYLNKGCILKVDLFEVVNNQIQESSTYIKVLKINPIKLDIDERRKAFKPNQMEAIFEIEFD